MTSLSISHSSKDGGAAEAIRIYLVSRGWSRKEIFLDFDVEGIAAHEKWKRSLAEANAGANALLCLASPDWLASLESQVERRVAETLMDLGRCGTRAVIVAILRDLKLNDLHADGFNENQIVDLSAGGASTIILAERAGRQDEIRFNTQALEKIERSLRMVGVAPESFEWHPRDPDRLSPYPGLEAFTENDAGVFFGRESRLADALKIVDELRRHYESRVLTIIAPSGAGKSSFLRAGLWPRLVRQSGIAPLVVLRPGAGIISGREGGLIYSLADWFRRAGQTIAAGDLRSRFSSHSTQEALALVLADVARAAGEGRTLIVAIDQAEELFDSTNQAKVAEATEFLCALFAMLATPSAGLELLVIFAIRSDNYDRLAAALVRASDAAEQLGAPRRQALQETSLTLTPLSATAYRDVIRRPAQIALKTDREIFEPALIDELVSTFTGADALPLLAMTVEQLFAEYGARQHIKLVDYQVVYGRVTGAEGPVRRALAEAYRIAGEAGTDETLKRLLIPDLVAWDATAGEGGAVRRRIALRKTLLDEKPDVAALADALASRQVRLLTRASADAGPTLEVAHEALLRVTPVKQWVEEFSTELRLRDEIEREASEWQKAEVRLLEAQTHQGEPKLLGERQRDIDSALAARRGPRLEAAIKLITVPSLARLLGDKERAFLQKCQVQETERINKQRRILGRAFVKPALQAMEDGLHDHALRLAAAGAVLAHDLDFAMVPELWGAAAQALLQSRSLSVLKGHDGAVMDARFSADGTRIVTASSDGTARLWDVETGGEIAVYGHREPVRSAVFSPDGRRIVTASSDRTARLWDVETGGEMVVLKGHLEDVYNAVFSPDGRRIVTASGDKTARLWDVETGSAIVLKGHTEAVQRATFSPDGRRIVTASSDRTARLWDAEAGTAVAVLICDTTRVERAEFSPDGRRIVTAGGVGTVELWDAESGTVVAQLKGHDERVESAIFSPDGRRIVTASWDQTARVWDAETGFLKIVLNGHEKVVTSAEFSPLGDRVLTASGDGTARLWDSETGSVIVALKAHEFLGNERPGQPRWEANPHHWPRGGEAVGR